MYRPGVFLYQTANALTANVSFRELNAASTTVMCQSTGDNNNKRYIYYLI